MESLNDDQLQELLSKNDELEFEKLSLEERRKLNSYKLNIKTLQRNIMTSLKEKLTIPHSYLFIYRNLSSNGLVGSIATYFGDLKALQYL